MHSVTRRDSASGAQARSVSPSVRRVAASTDSPPAPVASPRPSRTSISIDTASISLPTAEAVGEAKKADWFNVAKFPSARFVSSSIKNLGGGKLQVAGKLTIKGNTRDVTAPFTARQEGALTVVEGVLPVSRLAYKIGEGDWADTGTVADEVQIKFKVAIPAGK